MTENTGRSGWGWPLNARKCHYFVAGQALCGKWMYFGAVSEGRPGAKTEDDCTGCTRVLAKKEKDGAAS